MLVQVAIMGLGRLQHVLSQESDTGTQGVGGRGVYGAWVQKTRCEGARLGATALQDGRQSRESG